MKIYLAGALNFTRQIDLIPLGVKHVLSSWLEGKSDKYKDFEMFIDSGAFSAWKKGVSIKVEDYIHYLKVHKDSVKAYANLDVIGDAEATYENQMKMEAEGLLPVPTYHLREDIKWLYKYLEKHDYIALGGTVGSPRRIIEPFLDTCFSIIKEYWPRKIHGFGISTMWALKKYPFYSVDSTNWLMGGRYGDLFDTLKLSGETLPRNINSHIYRKILNYKEMGVKNIKQFLKLEKDMIYYWQRRGVIWKE